MNFWRKYRITIEDESHLTQVSTHRFRLLILCLVILGVFCIMLVAAGAIIACTPLRTMLPGYLKESQRSDTEESLMRLDSLIAVYDMNKAYIDNFLKVIDTERSESDSAGMVPPVEGRNTDTLIVASERERKFVADMEDKEKYNISVLAPLAAESMFFHPLATSGIFAKESIGNKEGVVLLPSEENVQNTADGSVISTAYTSRDRGYVVVVQHNRGFITSYSHVGMPFVEVGDKVTGGQIIALAPRPDAKGVRKFYVRMWHNGVPIVPYEYLGASRSYGQDDSQNYESPRGQ